MKLNGLEKYFNEVNGEIVNFKQVNNEGFSPLMFAFMYNKSKSILLKEYQLDYLIKNSDLNQEDNDGWNALMYAIFLNKKTKFKFIK